jgi:hypothetical protein
MLIRRLVFVADLILTDLDVDSMAYGASLLNHSQIHKLCTSSGFSDGLGPFLLIKSFHRVLGAGPRGHCSFQSSSPIISNCTLVLLNSDRSVLTKSQVGEQRDFLIGSRSVFVYPTVLKHASQLQQRGGSGKRSLRLSVGYR